MIFEQHLAALRPFRLTRPKRNPKYADELSNQLVKHLETVERWINGKIDRRAMAEAMEFFGTRYRAKGTVYRGTQQLVFDGKPASYTKRAKMAEGFAAAEADRGWGGRKPFFVIHRKAPAKSIDFSKLLKEYATCKIPRCDEAEVVLFNTPVGDRSITEFVV